MIPVVASKQDFGHVAGSQVRYIRWTTDVLGLGIIYYLAALIGLQFAIPPGNASAVWPPSGIAFAALIIRSRAIFPGIWLGAYFASLQTGIPSLVAASFATGNTLAAILGAVLYSFAFSRNRLFDSSKDAVQWLLIASVPGILAATCGPFSLYLGGLIAWSNTSMTWFTWCLGDLAGVMIVTPALISMAHWNGSWRLKQNRTPHIMAAYIVLCAMCHLLFWGSLPQHVAQSLVYLPIFVLLLLLLRFESETVFTGNLLIAALAVAGTSNGLGAFATGETLQSLFDLQLFLIVLAVTSLVMIVIVSSGRESELRRVALHAEIRDNESKLATAHEIQRGLFPSSALRARNCVCVGSWQPAELATADFFDFVAQPDGSVVVFVADVSGHGIGPALLMAETRAYSRALLVSPSGLCEKMRRLNNFLCQDFEAGRFVTMAICRFDPVDRCIEFIGAGHVGCIIRSNGSVERLESSTLPLGILPELPEFRTTSAQLDVGDTVFLCTDGIAEARSAVGELFGQKRLEELLVEYRHSSPDQLLRQLEMQVASFSSHATPDDDQTAALLRVT